MARLQHNETVHRTSLRPVRADTEIPGEPLQLDASETLGKARNRRTKRSDSSTCLISLVAQPDVGDGDVGGRTEGPQASSRCHPPAHTPCFTAYPVKRIERGVHVEPAYGRSFVTMSSQCRRTRCSHPVGSINHDATDDGHTDLVKTARLRASPPPPHLRHDDAGWLG